MRRFYGEAETAYVDSFMSVCHEEATQPVTKSNSRISMQLVLTVYRT